MSIHGKIDPEPTVVINAAQRKNRSFLKSWFDLAQLATELFTESCADEKYYRRVKDLEILAVIDFVFDAAALARAIQPHPTMLALRSELGDAFAKLYVLGFFNQSGPYYDMTLPISLCSKTVRDGMLRCALTGDDDTVIRPENIVPHLSKYEAWLLRDERAALNSTLRYIQPFGDGSRHHLN